MGIFGLNQKEKKIWSSILPGDRARMFLKESRGKAFETIVSEINDTSIFLRTPLVGNAYLELPLKLKVNLEIDVCTLKKGKAVFISQVRGQEWLKENLIRIACPKKIKWLNMRRAYRICVSLAAEFCFVDKEKSLGDLQIEPPFYKAEIRNISEGGALVVVEKISCVNLGDFMNIKIEISPGNTWKARAKVVHIELSQAKYGLGIQWAALKESQSKALNHFLAPYLKEKPAG